ncbi:MAG: glycosyltransferase, partial [Burkholderiaceae bacterium]|nr:glycosyltransferase [Burkholderiaceae bacterium]
ACGTPSIGGRSGGVNDAVVDGVTGLLVDPLDTAEVARSIDVLLANRDLARRLGDAARERAVSQFSWSRFGQTVASILDEVVRGRAQSVLP